MDWSLKIDSAFPRPLRVILRGVGQVFFCCNAVTGLIFLIAKDLKFFSSLYSVIILLE